MRPCYTFIAASANKPPSLSIFEDIGFWGVQAKDFLASLAAVEGPALDVEISSPGGDVFAAVAMYNGLRASGKEITTKVMGVAASAASLIFMAGDKRVMPKNTHLMVHNPSCYAGGNADDLREAAEMLDKIGTTVRSTYVSRSGMTDEAMAVLLSKDTWLTADESLANGLATEVTEEVKATASFDMDRADLPAGVRAVYMAAKEAAQTAKDAPSAFKVGDRIRALVNHMDGMKDMGGTISEVNRGPYYAVNFDTPMADSKNPHKWLAEAELEISTSATEKSMSMQPKVEPLAEDIASVASAAGFGAHAPAWALACTTLAEVNERIASAKQITSLCAVVKQPEMALDFIKDNKSVVAARAALVELAAKADEDSHVDTSPRQVQQSDRNRAKPKVSTASLWASHNSQSKK